LLNSYRVQEAVNFASHCLKTAPADTQDRLEERFQLQRQLYRALRKNKQPDEARKVMLQAVKGAALLPREKRNTQYGLNARTLLVFGEDDYAREVLGKATGPSADNRVLVEAWYQLADFHRERERKDEASTEFRKALAIDRLNKVPELDPDRLVSLSRFMVFRDPALVQSEMLKLIPLVPNQSKAGIRSRLLLAMSLTYQGRPVDAEKYYSELLNLNRTLLPRVTALELYGLAAANAKRLHNIDEAENRFQRAMEASNAFPATAVRKSMLDSLSTMLNDTANQREAELFLQAGDRLRREGPEVHPQHSA
jgi:tetratricopeptide (TPR) repeat protein